MELLKTPDGVKKSLTIEAIDEWMWVPEKKMIAYTAHLEEPSTSNILPKVAFISIPSRQTAGQQSFKNCENLKMNMHPQGYYLALTNTYRTKKSKQYAVELFDFTTSDTIIPH